MCLTFFASTFVILAIILTVQLITLCLGITNKMKPMTLSNYVSSVAGVTFVYVFNAFVLVLLVPDVYSKFILAAFGLIPFIIGSVANYYKLKFYSVLQILCVIMSWVYIIGL